MRKDIIVCHCGKNEYWYSVDKKKLYNAKAGIIIPNEESITIDARLRKISVPYDWRVPKNFTEILDYTYKAHSMRRHYRMDLYQTPVLPETAVRRAAQVKKKGQKIALIGDDDLVSIPLALMGHKVTVFDADEYLIDLINTINDRFSIDIKAIKVNLLDELELVYKEQFDVFFADPVSTIEGFSVFIKRGYELIKKNGIGFVTVTQRFQPVLDNFIRDCSLTLKRRYNGFCNSYNHKIELIDDVANMVELRKTSEEKFADIKNNLYFFESQKQMKTMCLIELFDTDMENIQKQIQISLHNIRDELDCCVQINKYISNDIYYLIYCDDRFKILITKYVNNYIEVVITSSDVYSISIIKRIFLDSITYSTKREEVFVCGLPVIKGRIDLEINSL